MAAKLKSITKLIHWSLLLRAVVFTLSWLYLPFWIFILLALYCYFVPAFHAGRLFVLFFTLLVLCYAEPSTGLGAVVMAIIFGAIFYYLLLKKDLLLIDRVTAHELLTMILSFFLFREFFAGFNQGPTGAALAWAFLAALLWSRLLNNLMARQAEEVAPREEREGYPRSLRRASVWLAFILMAQALIVTLFLPLNFIYQSTVVFLVAALLIELLPARATGALSEEKIRVTGAVVFALMVIVLGVAKW